MGGASANRGRGTVLVLVMETDVRAGGSKCWDPEPGVSAGVDVTLTGTCECLRKKERETVPEEWPFLMPATSRT